MRTLPNTFQRRVHSFAVLAAAAMLALSAAQQAYAMQRATPMCSPVHGGRCTGDAQPTDGAGPPPARPNPQLIPPVFGDGRLCVKARPICRRNALCDYREPALPPVCL